MEVYEAVVEKDVSLEQQDSHHQLMFTCKAELSLTDFKIYSMDKKSKPWNWSMLGIECENCVVKLRGCYLECFLDVKHSGADAGLGCVAHIFTLLKT